MILGIDEVGRGVWAGPLVVGAVVLGDTTIKGLTDSKALSKKAREQLAEQIHHEARAIGLGWVSAEEIDDIGLSEALRLATRRAVEQVRTHNVAFHEIIIDGTVNFLQDTPLESYVSTLKKADLLIASVSAASIVAKVARDAYMREQDSVYPLWKFASHVGYGTAAHRQAIEQHGVTPLHRLSIAPLQKYAAARKNSTPTTEKTTRTIGDESETAAAETLVQQGHSITARNWKTKYCEIDIVSKKNDTYYFTEVKHRATSTSGDGLAAITPKKVAQMRFAATLYAHRHKLAQTNLQLLGVATTGQPPHVVDIVAVE